MLDESERDQLRVRLREVRRRARVTRNDAVFQQDRAWRHRMLALELTFRARERRERRSVTR